MTRVFLKGSTAFTLIELLLVVLILIVVAAILVPIAERPQHGDRMPTIQCMSGQRQIGLGLRLWADDHFAKYPPQVPGTNGGTLEAIVMGGPAFHFGALSNYLQDCKLFVCPTDRKKIAASNYSALTDRNVSYFLNVDAAIALTNGVLSGDRHFAASGKPVPPGLFTINTNMVMDWTTELHWQSSRPVGVLLFADGHTERVWKNLSVAFQRQTGATNRLAVP